MSAYEFVIHTYIHSYVCYTYIYWDSVLFYSTPQKPYTKYYMYLMFYELSYDIIGRVH